MDYQKIHLCDTCAYCFADCDNGEEGKDFYFGTGLGNDNVYRCTTYKTEPKICPLLSTASHLSAYMGTNNNLVLCQEKECALWDRQNRCCSFSTMSVRNVEVK